MTELNNRKMELLSRVRRCLATMNLLVIGVEDDIVFHKHTTVTPDDLYALTRELTNLTDALANRRSGLEPPHIDLVADEENR